MSNSSSFKKVEYERNNVKNGGLAGFAVSLQNKP